MKNIREYLENALKFTSMIEVDSDLYKEIIRWSIKTNRVGCCMTKGRALITIKGSTLTVRKK